MAEIVGTPSLNKVLAIGADANSVDITGLPSPATSTSATNKAYVDGTVSTKENSITAGTTSQYWRGDKTWQTLDTSVVPENGNLYYTNARAIASTLTGYTSGAGTITSADTILGAIQKLNGNIGALIQTHNALPDLQGGTVGEYYHLTSAEYTGSGTGVFARVGSPTFTGTAIFDQINANTIHAVGSGGLIIESNAGTDAMLIGAGGGAGVTFYGGINGTTASFSGNVSPTTNDGAALGTSSLAWSDLFLASGGVINFNAGNYTLTHSAGLLTSNGAFTLSGNLTAGTNDTNTHIFRGAFSMAYGAGSTTRMSMTNTGLIMLGASTTPVAGVQLESGNAGTGTPSDYVLIKSSGSVANRGGLLISNQASVSGTTNSLKITGTFNSSTSGVASVGWVDNNATETWVGGVSSMIFAYNASTPFIRFNQTLQMLAGQVMQSSGSTANYINIDNSGNSVYATRSTARIQIDEDNNTTATALFQILADAGSVNIFQAREDGQFVVSSYVTTANGFSVNSDTITTGTLHRVYSNSSSASTRTLHAIINDNTLATGVTTLYVQNDSTGNIASFTGSVTSSNGLFIQTDSLTTGSVAYFYSNSANTSTRSLVRIVNDNAAATGTTVLTIQQDSTGHAVNIAGGISVLASSTTSYASLRLPHGTAPTSPVDGDIWTTTSSVYARVNGSTINLGSGGGGATTALDNLASVAINESLLPGTSDAVALGSTTKMWSDLFLASGAVINFNNGDVTITHASNKLTFDDATSGYEFVSSAASATYVIDARQSNSGAGASGSASLRLRQSYVTTTNFKKMIVLEGVAIYISDGTSPNGSLSGNAGDICLNGSGNQTFYCTGTTNWTAM